MGDDMPGHAGAAVPLADQRMELGIANFDDGELGGDEKAVERHQREDREDFQQEDEGAVFHVTR